MPTPIKPRTDDSGNTGHQHTENNGRHDHEHGRSEAISFDVRIAISRQRIDTGWIHDPIWPLQRVDNAIER
ncbi:hypothetical protein D3C71_1922990 [compost metagenome]